MEVETDFERAERYLAAIRELALHLGDLIACKRCRENLALSNESALPQPDRTVHQI